MYQKCIDQQTPPKLERGAVVDRGEFFRNLKKEHVVKRYPGDNDNNPTFGFKIHKRHWKYAQNQNGPLSVNQKSCIHSEACSIALQPGGEDYYHVAIINLQALNEVLGELKSVLASHLVAQYQPIDEIPNHCHFEIIPENGTNLAWMEIAALLDAPFPPASKMPVGDDDKRKATTEYEKYHSYLHIIHDVRNKDGSLG
jgi:hypothetical protein